MSGTRMSRSKRNWHPDFVKYMEYIVNHENYKGIPEPRKEDDSIRWVVSGNSELGKKRAEWWDKKVSEMKLENRAEVARAIHPKELKGLKPCQICGKKLSIFYVYPSKDTLRKINDTSASNFQPYEESIDEIFDRIKTKNGNKVFEIFRDVFEIPTSINESKEEFLNYIFKNCKTILSPGVMSNPPDRFDGFHTYNACCRSKEDTGRHEDNLARYSQDRRAYENWAEGNWNLSNRLMGEFQRFSDKLPCPRCGKIERMSADHIGPISLGFTHRPRFNPLCTTCNSQKNNRMNLDDVKTLIRDEKNGEKVISWHSKYVWNSLKNKIKSDDDALKLSKVMRWHLNNVLSLLYLIYSKGHWKFLTKYLHPDYSFVDYKFEDFDPLNLDKLKIIKKPLKSKNKKKNAERYIRISFESLEDYKSKENRNVKAFKNKEMNVFLKNFFKALQENKEKEGHEILDKIIRLLSEEAIKKFS